MRLSLDYGTTTGYALWADDGSMARWGSWELAPGGKVDRRGGRRIVEQRKKQERARDSRVVALHGLLRELGAAHAISHVAFEDVLFSVSTAQAHLWASFRTAGWLAFPGANFLPVNVQTLKYHSTGYGKANKDDMRAKLPAELELQARRSGLDDNAVDAYWVGAFFNFNAAYDPLLA
jgi:Holliday junction resolvasome RuvABC endonuclease subunit